MPGENGKPDRGSQPRRFGEPRFRVAIAARAATFRLDMQEYGARFRAW
ncbi:MAG TPA: hypothetical protein VNX86_07200 [Rhizomicrobium sp.]|nr:hypothetical protein [Rhizomicrobium sp.]